jgi:alpha,alpha-trehalase
LRSDVPTSLLSILTLCSTSSSIVLALFPYSIRPNFLHLFLLLRYETDIATAIRDVFGGSLDLEDTFPLAPFPISPETYAEPTSSWRQSTSTKQNADEWFARAEFRKKQIDKYLWNEGQKLYFDYDTKKKKQSRYESVTAFWAMWAGCASEDQALMLV